MWQEAGKNPFWLCPAFDWLYPAFLGMGWRQVGCPHEKFMAGGAIGAEDPLLCVVALGPRLVSLVSVV